MSPSLAASLLFIMWLCCCAKCSAGVHKNAHGESVAEFMFTRLMPKSMEHLHNGGDMRELMKAKDANGTVAHISATLAHKFGALHHNNVNNINVNNTSHRAHGGGVRHRRGVYGQEELNNYDEVWVGQIIVGTPYTNYPNGQVFNVQYDTGSATLWVPDATCSSCVGQHLFHSSASSSYAPNGQSWTVNYASGWAQGFLGRDYVTLVGIGGFSSLTIAQQTFGQANQVSANFYSGRPYDGYFGMAFQSLAADNVVPPMQTAINEGLLSSPLFEVYLTTADPSYQQYPAASWSGYYTFGGLDTTHCASPNYVPLTHATYFQIALSQVSVGSYAYTATMSAISDTGTALIMGKQAVTDPIAAAVGAVYSSSLGVYLINCNAAYSPVTFTINGVAYQLSQAVLTMNWNMQTLGGQCLFGVYHDDATLNWLGLDWILGTVFNRQFCVVYDLGGQRLGIAAHQSSG